MHIENMTINIGRDNPMFRAMMAAILSQPAGDDSAPKPERSQTNPPRIGEYWAGQGGIYAGVARGRDGDADYHLILAEATPEQDFAWQAALDHAKTIEADGHKDFAVPTRWESALLYANLQDKLNTDYWHWTSTQYSENDAWVQLFSYGFQRSFSKSYERRCRFVRRSVL
jgi:hypothetical protein